MSEQTEKPKPEATTPCAEKDRLTLEYGRCAVELIRTELTIKRFGESSTPHERAELVIFFETAQLKREQALAALARHMDEHGC